MAHLAVVGTAARVERLQMYRSNIISSSIATLLQTTIYADRYFLHFAMTLYFTSSCLWIFRSSAICNHQLRCVIIEG